MIRRNFFGFMFLITAVLLIAGCSNEGGNQWTVKGNVDNAKDVLMLLEQDNGGEWVVIDSLRIAEDGNFEFAGNRNEYPTIYRLKLNDGILYFPVDSTETISVKANLNDFGSGKISGSLSADKMQKINEAIAATVAQKGEEAAVTDETLKENILKIIGTQWDGIAAYYVINKQIGGKKLYDISRKNDLKVIRAVANMFHTTYPDDPRTQLLTDIVLGAMRGNVEYYAQEIPLIEIALPDDTGEVQSLSKIWKNSKVLILDFNDYSQDYYPAYNIVLGEVYNKYKDNGLAIYQVGFDSDEFNWARTARNLPWTTVYNSADKGLSVLGSYNVTSFPTLFVFDHSGEKVVRLEDIDKLESTVKNMI